MNGIVFDLSKAEIVPLSETNLSSATDFDCNDRDLNEFLKDDALDHSRAKVAVTYLFVYDGKVLGFFCLSMFAIKPTDDALIILRERGKKYSLFPALLIARLGVGKVCQRRGVGSEIIKTIIGLALKESERVGCRFIVVDAYPNSVSFYEKNGFKVLSRRQDTIKMYLDLLREF